MGFTTVVLLNLLVISSPVLRALLFPGNIFIRYATNKGVSDFGLMIYDSLAYFTNILLYAAAGFCIGRLFQTQGANKDEG